MSRRGRDLLFEAMEHLGIQYLFGNPGTTELPVIDGCTAHPAVQYVTALHEDIAVAIAMGYARATGKVGVVNLHVAPGLAHGLGNLYNAWRASIPILVTAGQQETGLQLQEPILTGNLAEMARPYTKWSYEVKRVQDLPMALQRAFKEAMSPPAGPVFLSLPADVMLAETGADMPPITRVGTRFAGDPAAITTAAAILARAERPIIVAGDGVGLSGAWTELADLAERIGAPVFTEGLSTLANFSTRHPNFAGPLPASPAMRGVLADADVLFLCGVSSQAPTAYYDGGGPLVPASATVVALHHNPWELGKNQYAAAAILGDVQRSLVQLNREMAGQPGPGPTLLAERVRAVRAQSGARRERWQEQAALGRAATPIAAAHVAAELAAVWPQAGVLASEAISNNASFVNLVDFPEPLALYHGKGGGLGHAMGAALGIKLGDPARTVVSVVGDGTFLYYPQVLWTAASLGIHVLFVVLNNQSYRILKQGLKGMGGPWGPPGTYPPGLDISAPAMDFAAMAGLYGVAGERVTEPGQVRSALERGLSASGPYLLDVVIDRSV
jgi:benzoylformate decarboxylase